MLRLWSKPGQAEIVADAGDWTTQFERVTRQLRWLVLFTIGVTLPFERTRAHFMILTLLAAALYNASRYTQVVLRNRILGSPLTMILTDAAYVAMLVMLIGNPVTAFSTFFIYMVISIAYRYGWLASVLMASAEFVWMAAVLRFQWFEPVHVSQARSLVVYGLVLLGLATLAYRLTYIDSAERDQLRLARRKSETERSHLLAFVNSMTEAIFVVNANGRIVMVNDSAILMTGLGPELQGLPFDHTVYLFQRNDVEAKPVRLLEETSGNERRRDLCIRVPDGAQLDLAVTVKKVQLTNDGLTDYIIVCEDITSERSLDEERSEFISVASHELRTPVAILEAALSTALQSKDPVPETTRSLIKQAHDNAIYLTDIMKDLSMLSQARNDNIPIQMETVDTAKLVHELQAGFEVPASEKGLKLVAKVDSDIPNVMSTERHIREILQNYLTNAIKYSDRGTVRLSAEKAQTGGVVFSVHDTGIGISPKDQKYLFTKFFRAEDYRTHKTSGTGLGLYLCRELAERIEAKVWCESKQHEGSTFYLEVPPFSGEGQKVGVTKQVVKLLKTEI